MLVKFFRKIKDKYKFFSELLFWYLSIRKLTFNKKGSCNKLTLISNLHTNKATAKIDVLFSIGLRSKGNKIILLLEKKNLYNEILFKLSGRIKIKYLDNYIDKNDIQLIDEKVIRLLKNNKIYDLFDYEEDGVRIGRNSFSLALRKLRIGKINVDNLDNMHELKKSIRLSLISKMACERLLNEIKPDLVLFVERGYSPSGELFDLAIKNQIDVIQWQSGPSDNSLFFKRYDSKNKFEHPLSLGKNTIYLLDQINFNQADQEKIITKLSSNYKDESWYNRQQLQKGKTILTKSKVRELLEIDSKRKIAVIFCHILYDATFFYGESIFKDYESWLIETIKIAIKNPNLDWLIKVHPVNCWRSQMDNKPMEQLEEISISKNIGELPPHIKILKADSKINTFSLFDLIDYGLTVRGTIGLELPCFGVPVITAGSGRYSGNGFTIDPTDYESYKNTLMNIHRLPRLNNDKAILAQKYLLGTLSLRQINISSFYIRNTLSKIKLSETDLILNKEELKNKKNFVREIEFIVDWMLNSKSSDLVNKK